MLLTIMAVVATFKLSPLLVQFLVGVLIPILVGALTKARASAKLKQVLTIVLSGISALIIASLTQTGGAEVTETALLLAAMGWLTSIASYLGVYKPNGLNDKLSPQAGLGSPESPPTFPGFGSPPG